MTPARRAPGPARPSPRPRTPEHAARNAVAIFLVALALRLFHVWQIRRSPFFDVLMGDARGYDAWASRIAGGEWIGRDVFYQAPLYPYFLGVVYSTIGHSLIAVRVAQAVIGSASCVLLGGAASRFVSPRAGLLAGIGLAIYAPAIFFDALIQKSVLDVFFLSLALWSMSHLVDDPRRARWWMAVGLSMGALSLTRENALVFVAVIVAWGLGRPMSWPTRARALGIFIAGLAIVLLPVAIRNYAVGGGFYLTTSQFGPNFYIGNNAKADGTYVPLRYGRGAPEYERQDATELAEHATGRSLTPAEVSAFWTDRAMEFVTGHPGAWLKVIGRKMVLLWNATETLDTESQESYAEWSWPLRIGGAFAHFGLLVPLALLGAIISWPQRRRLALIYAMTVAYAASVIMFYVFARYRLPLVPFLMIFAAAALDGAARWMRGTAAITATPRSRQWALDRSHVVALAGVGAAAVFCNWPVLSRNLMKAVTETNLGTALDEAGRTDEAIAHYRRAVAVQPDYAPAYNNLGVALRARGDVAGAIETYRRALTLETDFPDAHYNLANALLADHKAAEAAEHFRVALQSIPDSAGVRNNLGIALAAAGRPDEAIAAFREAVEADPRSAKAHRNLGDSLAAAGHVDEGIVELRRAIALEPGDADMHYTLGNVLLQRGQLDEAITEFRKTLELSPRSAAAHNNLGIALGSQGHLDAAVAEFQQALKVDPRFADSQRNLALALKARGSIRHQ